MADFTTEWEVPEFGSVPSLAENMAYLLPGCDPVLVRKSLQHAYMDFCRRSAALKTWRSVQFVPGVFAYPVAPILSSEIDCVTQVVRMHSRVPLRTWCVVGDNPPMLRLPHWFAKPDCDAEHPNVVYEQTIENVGSMPVATEPADPPRPIVHGVLVEAVEVPHIGEERAPKAFLSRYGDALVDGALFRLFSMQGRAWTDVEQARQRGIAYTNALSEARQRSMFGGPSANANAGFALDMSSMV